MEVHLPVLTADAESTDCTFTGIVEMCIRDSCSTDTRYSGFISVTESGLLKRLVELGLVGTVMQYYTFFHPLIKGLKEYNKAIKKNPMVIFFMTVILCFLVEDLILQRYTELEYTIILWCSVSYISYCQKDDAKL